MGISGRIARFFLTSQLTPLLALVLVLLGVFAIVVTPREEEPQIDVTMANVLVPFPGASAEDVEQLVAIPAEQVLSQIQGLEHVWSVSRPGQAMITVQYKVGVKRTDAIVRLHDTILSHRDWLPPELGVGEPLVKPKGIDDVPIVSLTLWTTDPDRGAFELERVAHAVEAELKRVPGTREVTTIGGPGRVVAGACSTSTSSTRIGLAAGDLDAELQGAERRAAGRAASSRGNATVLVETGEFLEIGAGRPRPRRRRARRPAGLPVRRRARRRRPAAARALRLVRPGKAGATDGTDVGRAFPAVTVQMTKKAGRERRRRRAARRAARSTSLENTVIPAGVEVTVTRDYGRTADDKAKMLIGKLMFATLSVVALVFVALGRREAADRRRRRAADAGGDAVRVVGLGLHAEPREPVRADLLHRHPGRRRDRRRREHPPPSACSYPDAPLATLIPRGGRRGRRPDDPRHVHRHRRAAADGVRHRADGAVHEPDPDQRQHGHGDLAGDRVHDHAVARAEARAEARRPRGARARVASTGWLDGDLRAAADAVRRPRQGRPPARAARHRHRRRDPRLGVARGRPAGRAEDAAVRQQERVPGHRRPAGRLAGRGDGGGAGRARRELAQRSPRSPTSRPTPARPRRSTSTASSASTICASCRSRATCRSTSSTASIARARATRSRWRCARRWRRSAPRHQREGQGRRGAAGAAGALADRRRDLRPRRGRPPCARQGRCARRSRATPRHRRHRRLDRGQCAADRSCASTSARRRSPGIDAGRRRRARCARRSPATTSPRCTTGRRSTACRCGSRCRRSGRAASTRCSR